MRLFIIGSVREDAPLFGKFNEFCRAMGRSLAGHQVTIILCSPYPGASDLAVVEGLLSTPSPKATLELHYPDTAENQRAWQQVLSANIHLVKVDHYRHEAAHPAESTSVNYAWLFCQLQAVATANRAVIIGGKPDGSANLLTRIAEAQSKDMIPLAKFGGVGELYFNRTRYQLQDILGTARTELLYNCEKPEAIAEMAANELTAAEDRLLAKTGPPVFFISYARETPAEADFIEMQLRRRQFTVLRDDEAIAAGAEVTPALREMIYKSTVFIAVWSKEYACSPWCFDELELGLSTHLKPGRALWLFRVDKTRIIHRQARSINYYDTFSRAELERTLLKLLEKI